MQKEELQRQVDMLAKERKAHLDTIENLTLKDIKNIVSSLGPNYSCYFFKWTNTFSFLGLDSMIFVLF